MWHIFFDVTVFSKHQRAPAIKHLTMKLSAAVSAILVGSTAAWTMKAGKCP
jgi:hypothetical protein